ncbi:MAG TPA: ribbon-helix-helix domain-containing protein [Chloroflexota bacterium]
MRPSRTVTISLPPELAEQVDEIARSEHRTRSELLREAVRQYAVNRKRWDDIFSFGKDRAHAARLTSEDLTAKAAIAYRRRRGKRG